MMQQNLKGRSFHLERPIIEREWKDFAFKSF